MEGHELKLDEARFCRPSGLAGLELVSVCYRGRSFPTHSHPEYVVGIVTSGEETLELGTRSYRAPAGSTLMLNPNEAHSNAAQGNAPLRYDVFYLSPDCLGATTGEDRLLPRMECPVSSNPRLFTRLGDIHAHLRTAGVSDPLLQQSALTALVSLVVDHSSQPAAAPRRAPQAVERARAYIDAHFAESFGLLELVQASGASMFHLVRSFKKATGLTPLAYRNQKRLAEARRRILEGDDLAQAAAAAGFADQSHMTRQFQRIIGVSPARYAKQ